MSKRLVTVIIPVYNVNKYIEKCIGSLINQTYKNIEIILIDDGSRDNSLEICNRIEKKDDRIIVISKENSGVSDTRNVGIEKSSGEYICFVDSDDFLPPDAIESLVFGLESKNVDLCCGSWTILTTMNTIRNNYTAEVIDTNEKSKLAGYLEIEEVNGPVAKLFKSKIIKENHLAFPNDMKIGEDAVFNYKYISHCKNVSIIDRNVYFYNKLNATSATHNFYDGFGRCSLLCGIEQSKNLSNNAYDDILSQVSICKRFLSAVKYILYYDLDRDIAVNQLENVFRLFNEHINMSLLSDNKEQFEECISIIESFKNDQYLDFYNQNKAWVDNSLKGKIKNTIIKLISSYKIFSEFKIKKGKFNL